MFIAPEPSRPEGILDVLNDRIVEAALGDRVCHRKAVNHAPAAAKHDHGQACQIGPMSFRTRDEADKQVTVICKEKHE